MTEPLWRLYNRRSKKFFRLSFALSVLAPLSHESDFCVMSFDSFQNFFLIGTSCIRVHKEYPWCVTVINEKLGYAMV